MEYKEFIKNKIKTIEDSGFYCEPQNEFLFDFQKHIVKKALKAGRYAVFADCGLGKTLMQLTFANEVVKRTKRPVLILAPLAVVEQTKKEAEKFKLPKIWKLDPNEPLNLLSMEQHYHERIYITNYEQLDNIKDISPFSGIVLDESSILKNFTGKYKNLIIDKFKDTPYKLACTATPSPNDLNEIGNHSEFLNILDAQDMRSKWFVRDEGMNNYRLKGHAKNDFYGWISSWATMLSKPSDIGFNADGYDLPKLNFVEKEVLTDKKEDGLLFNETSVNATTFNKELRLTINKRFEEVANIVNSSSENFIVWVNQNEEEKKALELIPDAVAVNGSDAPEKKAKLLLGFANNEFRVLVTKKKIAQFGLNYQNCNNQVFASLDFSFESLYQAIRRSYRFGQKKQVNIFLIRKRSKVNQ